MNTTIPKSDKPGTKESAVHGTERPYGQIVLVLQGGGALGAYQAGVYQALSEAGMEPDWVIGTSIGAINGAIIAGNEPSSRRARLQDFWSRIGNGRLFDEFWTPSILGSALASTQTLTRGVPGFFQPKLQAAWNVHLPVGVEQASFYTTQPLRETLTELVDFDYINHKRVRFTAGAVNVRTGRMCYFDCRDTEVHLDHVMASGALPPGFPAVRIEGESYWDGGVYSNTPIEVVLDDNPRRDSLIFSVNIWHAQGAEPKSILQVIERMKDIRFASRAESHIARQAQIHRLHHVVRELEKRIPPDQKDDPAVKELAGYGCHTTIHLVRLLAPQPGHEDHTKDIDFTRAGIRTRWQAGYADALRVLQQQPWQCDVDSLQAVVVHELTARAAGAPACPPRGEPGGGSAMPDNTKTPQPGEFAEQVKVWEALCTTVLGHHRRALEQWLRTVQSVSNELPALTVKRLQLAMEGWSGLAACRNLEELINWSRRMTSKMTVHCAEEVDKLSQMTMKITLLRPMDPRP
jgi:NTE family protein